MVSVPHVNQIYNLQTLRENRNKPTFWEHTYVFVKNVVQSRKYYNICDKSLTHEGKQLQKVEIYVSQIDN